MNTISPRALVPNYQPASSFNLVKDSLAKVGDLDQQVENDENINVIYRPTDPEYWNRRSCSPFGFGVPLSKICRSYFCPWCRARRVCDTLETAKCGLENSDGPVDWIGAVSFIEVYDPASDSFLSCRDDDIYPTSSLYSDPAERLRTATRLVGHVRDTQHKDYTAFSDKFGQSGRRKKPRNMLSLILGGLICQDIFFDLQTRMFAVHRVTFFAVRGKFLLRKNVSRVCPDSPDIYKVKPTINGVEELILQSLPIRWLPALDMRPGERATARLIDVKSPNRARRIPRTSSRGIFWGV